MLESIAAAGAWIRKFKDHYVELQSLREKKVHQDLMEMEIRLESLRKKIPEKIQFEAIQSNMEKMARENKEMEEVVKEAEEWIKDKMNELEKEKQNPMEK
ncbi:PREDICTED: PRUPE_1G112200 [Prunus dulcis]|uniref:PREDICTED: PRUPE_1G112200 n=1 Tax=Prunus dulcis TaxID=3755 RepID=A0A5E4FN25_PRUDU|nr:PREDICTED: PRUPE_1G112200 [Prunus dulcis]